MSAIYYKYRDVTEGMTGKFKVAFTINQLAKETGNYASTIHKRVQGLTSGTIIVKSRSGKATEIRIKQNVIEDAHATNS
jgi:hypothetical protein